MHLESRHLAPGTINLRLGAVRRLAYEAADSGLLSADLAAGIRRVKGVKKLGVRLGNWLTPEQGNALWQAPNPERLRGKRDRALLAILLACGLRRHEIAELTLDHFQKREEHWAIVDLVGKGGHIRTIPVPDWVYCLLNDWMLAAGIQGGRLFRRVSSAGKPWGDGVTEKLVWHVVKEFARLPADQLVEVARSIRIRFGLITTPFRSSVRHFWTTSQRNSGSLFRCSEPASVAESRPVQEWLRRGRDLRGMNLHRRLLIGNPNA